MCIHGFVKFMQNLCSDLKVLQHDRIWEKVRGP